MPLVIFNYTVNEDGQIGSSPDSFTFKQILPQKAQDKRWTLRAVNVLVQQAGLFSDMKYVELHIPELMNRDSVLYSGVGKGVQEPDQFFRFYIKNYQLSQNKDDANAKCDVSASSTVSEYPNWDLGTHHLEKDELTFIFRVGEGNLKRELLSSPLDGVNIILSYE